MLINTDMHRNMLGEPLVKKLTWIYMEYNIKVDF